MDEQESLNCYLEQFTGDEWPELDVETTALPGDIPAFSPDCPYCHGTGVQTDFSTGFAIAAPCFRCFDLVGR